MRKALCVCRIPLHGSNSPMSTFKRVVLPFMNKKVI